tara:strand:+ start:343 stop:543 length:201 start_codon:yes stop_codon:yes gene_type:complete
MTEVPEKIWACDAKLGSPDDKYWWPNNDTGGTEYTRSDIADARIAELEAEGIRHKRITDYKIGEVK